AATSASAQSRSITVTPGRNAKSVLFFGSIFVTTLPLAVMSINLHVFVIIAFFLNSVLGHGVVSTLLSTPMVRRFTDRYRSVILILSGFVFVAFALMSIFQILST
ncbi:MAG: hypothetical protein OXC62_08090, partial [Aestuariivita sp.]|nr:hypothetical protein [Aestuariivita sp.]